MNLLIIVKSIALYIVIFFVNLWLAIRMKGKMVNMYISRR